MLTEAEAVTGICPDCGAPLTGGPAAPPVITGNGENAGNPPRGWTTFLAGVAIGILVAAAGAAAGWWALGRPPLPAAPVVTGDREETAGPANPAREQVAPPSEMQATAERAQAEARGRLEAALARLAAAEKERTAAEAKLQTAQTRVADLERAQREVPPATETQRTAERALAEAQTRLDASRAERAAAEKERAAGRADREKATEQARQAEAAARVARDAVRQADTQRTGVEAALTNARGRLKAIEADQAAVDRKLAETRTRLQAAEARASELDRALADRKAQLADRDRELAAKRDQLAALDREAKARAAKTAPPPVGPPSAGVVRDWLVAGPFPAPDRKGHAVSFPPEAGPIDPNQEFKGPTAPVRWQAHASPADYVDLANLFKTEDPAVGYAACWVRAAKPGPAVLSLGSNDGIKVWVNGKVVATRPVSRSAAPGQDRVACDLAAGWNEVRVKVDNTGGPWGFYLEVRDAAGDKPLPGLEARATPPRPAGKK